MERRQLLKVGSVTIARAALPRTPIALAVAALALPTPALAWWQAVLMVVSLVLNMVAAANRSDGGLGAMFKASLDYQRTMAAQLVSLQDAMVQVLTKLNDLDATVRSELQLARLEDVRALLKEAISRYIQEASVRAQTFAGRGDYTAWIANTQTQDELKLIDAMLKSAVTQMDIRNWLDPWTVLLLPVAANVALAVRRGMNEQEPQLRAEGQRYLTFFQHAESENRPGSTASELRTLQGQLKAQLEVLRTRHGCVLPVDGIDGQVFTALVAKFDVQDYLQPQVVRYDQHCEPGNGPRSDTPPRCFKEPKYGKAYFGASDTYAVLAHVRSELLPRDGPPGSLVVRQYTVLDDLSAPLFVNSHYPTVEVPQPLPVLLHERALTTEERTRVATSAVKVKGEAARLALSKQIELVNITLGRMALCVSALTASVNARNSIYRAFGVEA